MDYPADWTQSDIEYCWYCDCCGRPMKDGSEELHDANGNAVCSEDCKTENDHDIGRDS